MGPPFGVFGINNRDVEHNIYIQIFDSNNRSEIVSYPETERKSVYDKDRLFPSGAYTFKIILDDNVTKIYKDVIDNWSKIRIDIDNNGNMNIGRMVG